MAVHAIDHNGTCSSIRDLAGAVEGKYQCLLGTKLYAIHCCVLRLTTRITWDPTNDNHGECCTNFSKGFNTGNEIACRMQEAPEEGHLIVFVTCAEASVHVRECYDSICNVIV